MGFKTNSSGGGGGGSATVKNSDNSYSTTVASGGTLILPDTTINVYVNGILNTTIVRPSMVDRTINITA
jgi:hypothetical protein